MKRRIDILIFQPDLVGHGITYLNCLLKSKRWARDEIVVCLRRDIDPTPEETGCIKEWREAGATIEFILAPAIGRPLSRAWTNAWEVIRVLRHFRPRRLLMTTGDGVLQVLGLISPIYRLLAPKPETTVAIMHQCSFLYPSQNWRKRVLNAVASHAVELCPISQIMTVDELAWERAAERGRSHPWRLLRDPIFTGLLRENTMSAKAEFGIDSDAFVIGCAGLLSERKGIDRLIKAFADAALPTGAVLLLVGRPSAGVLKVWKAAQQSLDSTKSIRLVDGYVSEIKLQNAIQAMDIVCVPYPAHNGISSILLRGVLEKKFIVGSNSGWIERVASKYSLGETCDVTRPGELAARLSASVERARSYRPAGEAIVWVRQHSVEVFVRTIWCAMQVNYPT